jgi:hypothetical protein
MAPIDGAVLHEDQECRTTPKNDALSETPRMQVIFTNVQSIMPPVHPKLENLLRSKQEH